MAAVLVKEITEINVSLEAIKSSLEMLSDYLVSQSKISDFKHVFNESCDTENKFFDKQQFFMNSEIRISQLLDFEKELINKFVYTIFNIQFCWADKMGAKKNIFEDLEMHQDVINLSERFMTWFEQHNYLSYNLLLGYQFALSSESSSPVVRNQIIYSFFRWMKLLSLRAKTIVPSKCYKILKNIVTFGITDVWSAVRKDTAMHLAIVLELLSVEKLEDFFQNLIMICKTGKSCWHSKETWQAVEGAIRGVDKVLNSCNYIPTSSVRKELTNSPSVLIKIGKSHFDKLPFFITGDLEDTLFHLFAHPQCGIREIAGKTFALFLNKLDFSSLMSSFDRVLHHLNAATQMKKNIKCNFMNAYEAEGFVNAVLFLIKSVPLTHLMRNWYKFWTIITFYLIHPASTVRQSTSTIFKYLVSKDLSSPTLLSLVVQGLCSEWKVILDDLKIDGRSNFVRPSVLNINSFEDMSSCWEWREGRLFVYELILKFLITNHLFLSSTSSRSRRRAVHDATLNNSLAEGQLRNAIMKQPTMTGQSLTTASPDRQKLTKSLTQSMDGAVVPDVQKQVLPSLLMLCKVERSWSNDKTLLFLEEIPLLHFDRTSDLSSVLLKSHVNKLEQTFYTVFKEDKVSFNILLKQIFFQIIESLQDSRWELRRMSSQLLPTICEVILYYDAEILNDLYANSFNYRPSKLYLASNLCLLQSIKLYVKYKKSNPEKSTANKLSHVNDLIHSLEKQFKDVVSEITKHVTFQEKCDTTNLTMQFLLYYQLYCHREVYLDELICGYVNSFSQYCRNSKEVAVFKDYINLLTECKGVMLEYFNTLDERFLVLLVPTFLQAIYILKSVSIEKHTLVTWVDNILQKLIKFTKTTKVISFVITEPRFPTECLIASCDEICNIIMLNDSDIGFARQLIAVVCYLQLLLTHNFPLTNVTKVIINKISLLDPVSSNSGVLFEIDKSVNNRGDGLSYSTGSIDSMRFKSSNSEASTDEETSNPDDDSNSDWDWSSSDENKKNEYTMSELYSGLITQLQHQAKLLNKNNPRL